MPQIEIVTIFKITKESDRDKVLEQIKEFKKTAVKDGEPLVIALQAGHISPSPKTQGWTLAIKAVFESQEHLDYYNFQCPAHKKLKAVADEVKDDVMVISFADCVG